MVPLALGPFLNEMGKGSVRTFNRIHFAEESITVSETYYQAVGFRAV